MLENHKIPDDEKERILEFAARNRDLAGKLIATGFITDEIHEMSREEYEEHPVTLSLAGMFYEKDIFYTYEEYSEHLRQAKEFETENKNYSLLITGENVFRNLQITLCKGEWVMVSKTNAPAIHFVIFYPRLRNAIENFVPPIIEE